MGQRGPGSIPSSDGRPRRVTPGASPAVTPTDNASAKLINPSKAPSRRFAYLLLLTLALVLFVVRAQVAVNDPFFSGDAAFRMNHANRPIVRMANRPWLPYLQTHIWAFYHLGLPAYAFHLIPCFYFLLAVSALGSSPSESAAERIRRCCSRSSSCFASRTSDWLRH